MNDRREPVPVEQILHRVRALCQRATRDREGQFWIEGIRHFVRACDARLQIDAVVQSETLLKSALADKLARRLAAEGVPRYRVSPEHFRTLSVADHASGIGAIVRQPWTPLERAEQRSGLCWIVVEQIRSPGNLGTILRTAEAAGASGIIFLDRSSDPFHPAVVRASMGGLYSLALVRATFPQLRRWAATRRILFVGLSPDGGFLWTDLPLSQEVALIVGEERGGLSERLRSLCHASARLPVAGGADSLNVAVATGVMLYELVRRSQMRA
jgi:TrmH family RNA methyltransferase